ncbi:MAG: hypothetical protein CMP14_01350 [Rickettsiales bacterium]|jgi:hypothetical protein|nr:hypothetical protein [Rickettsiales bacterium]|tara:strand:- start:90 stop:515 length:426 start_codon:yes stop_codon:yes gene_type:complete
MSPLALIPIGLYTMFATAGAEVDRNNTTKPVFEPEQKISLEEDIVPSPIIQDDRIEQLSMTALAAHSGLADPSVKDAIAKALRMQVEKTKKQLVQKSQNEFSAQMSEENPGRYFPQTDNDNDGGYSAPLGLKDESHNDWMK